MSPCLVQQLFRQKIGIELDQSLIDEVLFPMLRSRKDYPRELLQDIKLTSEILIVTDYARARPSQPACRRHRRRFNVPTFTPIPEYWAPSPLFRMPYPPEGKRPSKILRKKIRRCDWGAIDILNELRELNYPQMGYRPTYYLEEKGDFPGDEFDDAYIRLEEDNSLPLNSWFGWTDRNTVAVAGRARFVNDFLNDVLVSGKLLTWDGGGGFPGLLGWEPCKLPLHPPFQYLCRQYHY
jgi:hypothetical protein